MESVAEMEKAIGREKEAFRESVDTLLKDKVKEFKGTISDFEGSVEDQIEVNKAAKDEMLEEKVGKFKDKVSDFKSDMAEHRKANMEYLKDFHGKEVAPKGKFVCDICGFRAKSKGGLATHKRSHEEGKEE